MGRDRGDRQTLDLLGWEPPDVTVGFHGADRGRAPLAVKISQAIGVALAECGQTREKVADAMSKRLGERVSKGMLDAYASPAHEHHKISLERFLALVEVTGCHALLGFVAELFGFVVVPERFAAIIELHLIEEHEAEIARRKAALLPRVRKAGR